LKAFDARISIRVMNRIPTIDLINGWWRSKYQDRTRREGSTAGFAIPLLRAGSFGSDPRMASGVKKGAVSVTPVSSAIWCMVFALAILAVLMLDHYIARLERNRRQ
jgi:hypothetical protein